MNFVDLMGDILKFRGFMGAPLKEKLKWIFVLYPFFVFALIYYIGIWMLFLYEMYIWNPIKKHWKITLLVLLLIVILPPVIKFTLYWFAIG